MINSINQPKFTIRRGAIEKPGTYDIILQIFSKDFSSVKVYEESTLVQVASAPFGGSILVNATEGEAFSDYVLIAGKEWQCYDPDFTANLTF